MSETDLFGNGPSQHSMFGDGDGRIPHPQAPSHLPKPEDIRARLQLILTEVRSAERMPWDDRKARMWQTVFPQRARGLPDDERDQLCFEFTTEIERLKKAA
jgi:hypothetical protein